MIQEMLTYFASLSKASPEAKSFGHLYESIALVQREKRCRKFWLSHRQHCKTFIAENLLHASKFDSVLVLGSGPLHEIPLEILAKTFSRVDLVDIVHLKSTRAEYAHYKNVKFIEADITELESELLNNKKALSKLPSAFLNSGHDLVISANLMSQLAYHLRDFLQKKARPALSEKELDEFANLVTLNHYLYLKSFSCPVILITDVQSVFTDKKQNIIETALPYIDFSFPKPRELWWWNVAPIPEYSKELSLKMQVAAFLINV